MNTRTFRSKTFGIVKVEISRHIKGKIYFDIEVEGTQPRAFTDEELKIIQEHLGYHPFGYGFTRVTSHRFWCYNNCN